MSSGTDLWKSVPGTGQEGARGVLARVGAEVFAALGRDLAVPVRRALAAPDFRRSDPSAPGAHHGSEPPIPGPSRPHPLDPSHLSGPPTSMPRHAWGCPAWVGPGGWRPAITVSPTLLAALRVARDTPIGERLDAVAQAEGPDPLDALGPALTGLRELVRVGIVRTE